MFYGSFFCPFINAVWSYGSQKQMMSFGRYANAF